MKTKQSDIVMPAGGGGSEAALPLTGNRLAVPQEADSAAEIVTLQLSRSAWARLEGLAMQKGTDIRRLASDLLELALADGGSPKVVPTAAGGYRWRDLTLPAGTELSFKHRGVTYVALVKDGSVVHDGRHVSPSKFINAVAGPGRNAWLGLWVRRPGDLAWLLADELRRMVEMQQIAHHVLALDAARMATNADSHSPPSNPAVPGISSPAPPGPTDPSSTLLARPRRRRRRLVNAPLG